jgi:Zn finger protein HypA/HybF involved in hydrogenase expression
MKKNTKDTKTVLLTNYIAQIVCEACGSFFESFEVTKEKGITDIKCPKCFKKKLAVLKVKRKKK